MIAREPVVSARHATVRLADGSRLLDFASGGFGYGEGRVVGAVASQIRRNPLATRHLLSAPLAQLAARLAEVCPGALDVSYLCNSGSEAIEGALKIARGYQPARRTFLSLDGSYHGSTLGALSVTGRRRLRAPFRMLPLTATFVADPAVLAEAVTRDTAAVIVEAWQAERAADLDWLRELRVACSLSGALLIADEIRTGLGRTGRMFCCDHADVVPDVLVVGGALGGGVLPIAGYVTARTINDAVYGRRDPSLHASGTGGNPGACAAALAALQQIEQDDLAARCATLGARLLCALRVLADRHSAVVAGARGLGFAAVLDLCVEGDALRVRERAARLGLRLRVGAPGRGGERLELWPPLLATEAELDHAVAVLDAALPMAGEGHDG